MFFKTDYHVMQVKSIAECLKGHPAILSTFIKLPFVIKIFILSIFEGRLRQVLLYLHVLVRVHLLSKGVSFLLSVFQGWHRLERYLNLEDFLEKSLKIKSVLKSTGNSLKSLEKSLNSTIFCRT